MQRCYKRRIASQSYIVSGSHFVKGDSCTEVSCHCNDANQWILPSLVCIQLKFSVPSNVIIDRVAVSLTFHSIHRRTCLRKG